MRMEMRHSQLLIILETKAESAFVDRMSGGKIITDDGLIAHVEGEVRLSDGYCEHYIRLKKKET